MFSYFLQEWVIQEENSWVFELMTIIVFQVADVLIYDHVMLYCCWYITELITVMLISTVIPGLVEHRLMYCLSSFTVGKLFDKKNRIQAFFDFQSQTDQGDGWVCICIVQYILMFEYLSSWFQTNYNIYNNYAITGGIFKIVS